MKALWLILLSTAALPAIEPAMKCDALAAKSFGDQVKINSGALVAAKANLPEHCDVRGVIWPEAGFAIKLPTAWNDRFEMVGNGGTAGTISMGAVDNAVRKGFAAASTDTGHDAAKEALATFAYETPDNPNGHRKFLDFAYLAVHETAVLSKQVIHAYYGAAPRYSYWVGCSTGGRQGLQEAQRYPDDFDGLVVGAPGLYNTGNSMRRIWIGQSQVGAAAIPVEKLPLLTKAVYDKCDAVDGLKDGLIDDPRRCRFDPSHDVPKCAGARGRGLLHRGPDRSPRQNLWWPPRFQRQASLPRRARGQRAGMAGEFDRSQQVGPAARRKPDEVRNARSAARPVLDLHHVQLRYGSPRAGAELNARNPNCRREEARRQNRTVFGLGRPAGESVPRNRVLRDGQQAYG